MREVKYHVKDMDGLSVMKLNQIQLDDLVMRIQNVYKDTPYAGEVFSGLEECLTVGDFKIIHIENEHLIEQDKMPVF